MTPKQSLFVAEYLKDLNATQAAIRAGYSETTASVIGCENLTKPNIAEAIAKAQGERAQKCGIDAEWVLKEAQKLYEAARDAAEYSPAVAALKLVGTHVDVQAFRERVANELSGQTTTRIELVALDDCSG